jgi:hypothetical protein
MGRDKRGLSTRDAITYVRVAFYGIACEEGIMPPRNGENVLPIGCRGFVTATPKQRNNPLRQLARRRGLPGRGVVPDPR